MLLTLTSSNRTDVEMGATTRWEDIGYNSPKLVINRVEHLSDHISASIIGYKEMCGDIRLHVTLNGLGEEIMSTSVVKQCDGWWIVTFNTQSDTFVLNFYCRLDQRLVES